MPPPCYQRDRQPVAVAADWSQFGAMLIQKPAQMLDLPPVGVGNAPALIDGVLNHPGLVEMTVTAGWRTAQYVSQKEVYVAHWRPPM